MLLLRAIPLSGAPYSAGPPPRLFILFSLLFLVRSPCEGAFIPRRGTENEPMPEREALQLRRGQDLTRGDCPSRYGRVRGISGWGRCTLLAGTLVLGRRNLECRYDQLCMPTRLSWSYQTPPHSFPHCEPRGCGVQRQHCAPLLRRLRAHVGCALGQSARGPRRPALGELREAVVGDVVHGVRLCWPCYLGRRSAPARPSTGLACAGRACFAGPSWALRSSAECMTYIR